MLTIGREKIHPGLFRNLITGYIQAKDPFNEYVKDPQRETILKALSLYWDEDLDWHKGLEDMGMTLRGESYSIFKGITLVGPSQRGKTMILRAFSALVARDKSFSKLWRFNEKVKADYYGLGHEATQGYINPAWLFLDDIGQPDEKVTRFGTVIDPVKEIILARDNYKTLQRRMIISSNLHGKDLEKRYGTRAYQRLKNNTNIIILS